MTGVEKYLGRHSLRKPHQERKERDGETVKSSCRVKEGVVFSVFLR